MTQKASKSSGAGDEPVAGGEGPPAHPHPRVLVLCTGNAARSVMAGALLDAHGVRARVTTAGTHVVEHQPMSVRTRKALVSIGVDVPRHRSRQVVESDVDEADLVVVMAAEHVRYMRRRHPAAADRTATLAWLARHLRRGEEPLVERVRSLGLADVDPDSQGDVDDPAGGEDADYLNCALEVQRLVGELVERLG